MSAYFRNGFLKFSAQSGISIVSLLSSVNISSLQKPIAVCLKQDKLSVYRIENIKYLNKSTRGKCRIIERNIDGQSYKIKVFSHSDNIVDIEIEALIAVNQSVV